MKEKGYSEDVAAAYVIYQQMSMENRRRLCEYYETVINKYTDISAYSFIEKEVLLSPLIGDYLEKLVPMFPEIDFNTISEEKLVELLVCYFIGAEEENRASFKAVFEKLKKKND